MSDTVTWYVPVCHDCERTVGRTTEKQWLAGMKIRHHNRKDNTDAVGNVTDNSEVHSFEAGYLGNSFPAKRPIYRDLFDVDAELEEAEA